MLRPTLITLHFLSLFLLPLSPALTQTNAPSPKLGLVLSGGGAKGLAHIGVLKVLEEEGIRPDIITGTSMGSLIGGLYACGYSAAQLEELVLGMHWDDILTNKIPLDRIAMEEKAYYGRFLVELPFDGLKPKLPSGLIRGQKIDELIRRQTLPFHGTRDFHQLPIPFACIATDVGNGRDFVQHGGVLPDAMRASMSIPTVFAPLVQDSLLLVDGGAMRNFPVSDAREMGADLIIGVQVGDGLVAAKDLHTAVDILMQASMFRSLLDDARQTALCDVYLRPDLTGYSTGSFYEEAVPVLIARGYAVADAQREAIRALAAQLPAARRNMPPPTGVRIPDSLRVDRLVVHTNEPSVRTLVERRLRTDGHIGVGELEQRIDLLVGTLNFDLVNYRVDPSQGDSALVVKAIAAPRERMGLSLNFDSFNQASLGVLVVSRDRIMPGSRLLGEVYIGRFPQADLSFLKYIGERRRWAGLLGGYYSRTPFFIRAPGEVEKQGSLRLDRYGWYGRLQAASTDHLTYGLMMGQEFTFEKPQVASIIEVPTEAGSLFLDLGDIDHFKSDRWAARAFFGFDNMDRPIYPRRGTRLLAQVGHLWNAVTSVRFTKEALADMPEEIRQELQGEVRVNDYDEFQRLQVQATTLLPLTRRFSAMGTGVLSLASTLDLSGGDQWLVGGMKSNGRESVAFWGLPEYDEGLAEFAMVRAGFQWELMKDLFWQLQGNGLFTALRPGFETLDTGDDTLWGFGSTVGMRTPLGVVQFGVATNTTDNNVLGYFNFGYRL
ncbi:MAG: patatin-like phospholipase family protein [Flavobacteriales bacterium]|nr:patatin-like phospholipase family protein [Flavobacteriales bacterium]